MNYGKIENHTAASRVYRLLRTSGRWLSGWDITIKARTTCASTRVSEVRHQLPDDELIETKCEDEVWYYRWKKIDKPSTAEQLELV